MRLDERIADLLGAGRLCGGLLLLRIGNIVGGHGVGEVVVGLRRLVHAVLVHVQHISGDVGGVLLPAAFLGLLRRGGSWVGELRLLVVVIGVAFVERLVVVLELVLLLLVGLLLLLGCVVLVNLLRRVAVLEGLLVMEGLRDEGLVVLVLDGLRLVDGRRGLLLDLREVAGVLDEVAGAGVEGAEALVAAERHELAGHLAAATALRQLAVQSRTLAHEARN